MSSPCRSSNSRLSGVALPGAGFWSGTERPLSTVGTNNAQLGAIYGDSFTPPKKIQRMAPGRTATDGAEAVRNCVWACVVRELQGKQLTWDELDQSLLPRVGLVAPSDAGMRPRTFHRYFSTGQDPASLRGTRGYLIDSVHEDPNFRVAKETYDHPIWIICGSRPPTPEHLIGVRRMLMGRLWLHRPTILERLVAAYHELPGFSNYAPSRLDLVESMYNLVEGGSLDALGVCACNYLLALDCGRLEAAMDHQEVLRWGLVRFGVIWRLRKDACAALSLLFEQRIIRRRHAALPARMLGFPLGQRAQKRDGMSSADSSPLADDLTCTLPVVPRTDSSEKFFSQFPSHHLKFAEALAIKEVFTPHLTELDSDHNSLDEMKFADALDELLDVSEDQCRVELDVLQQFKHINEAVAHVIEFLPPPPDVHLRYARRTPGGARIGLRAYSERAGE